MDQKIEALLSNSQSNTRAGKISAGLQAALQAYELAVANGKPFLVARALIAQAEAHFRLGQYPETTRLANQAAEWMDTIQEGPAAEIIRTRQTIQAHTALLLGRCAGETNDLSGAETYFRQVAVLSRLTGDNSLLVRGLHSISAGVYMPRGQFSLALAADEEALALMEKEGFSELIWAPLTTLSWVCYLSGQLERSATYLGKLKNNTLPGSLAEGWEKCIEGNLALESGDMEGARTGFAGSRSIGEAIGSPELNFYSRLGMARLNRWEGKPAAGEEWAWDAIKTVQSIGYRHLEGMAQVECGRCAWQKGNLEAAETCFIAALEILTPLQARLEMAQAMLLLAALRQVQDNPQADEAAIQALNMIHANGFHFMLDQERSFAYPVIAAVLGSKDKMVANLAVQLLEMLERTDPPPLRVATLGGLQVWQGSRQVERKALNQRRAGELLALLLVSPGQRLILEEAAESLWPDHEAGTAAGLLHQATSALRRALEPELPARFPSRYLRVEDGLVQLQCHFTRDAASWVDFVAFEAACREKDWEKAILLYHGHFLPDCSTSEWTLTERQHLSVLYQDALLEAAQQRLKDGNASSALEACRKLLAIEPWQEQAVLVGMRAARDLGDLASARRLYLKLEKTLGNDLGVEPHPDLKKLYHSL